MSKKRRKVIVIVYEDVNLLDASGPIQTFAQANRIDENTFYDYQTIAVSKKGGLIKTSSTIVLDTVDLHSVKLSATDTVIIAGGMGIERIMDDEVLINWIQAAHKQSSRIGSVCTGAYLLANTGLLDGKRATTHWLSLDDFQQAFPKTTVVNDAIYVCDQGIWSSAGITAGIDLALAMLAEEIGDEASLEVARQLVVYMKRSGGQAQFSQPLNLQMKDSSGIFNQLHVWIKESLNLDLSVERLAEYMNMSSRTFYRSYKQQTGITPAKAVEKLRTEFVKQRLEDRNFSIAAIVTKSGFNTEERMRRAFINQFGISPIEYRRRFAIKN